MRKITQETVNAFFNGYPLSKSNTLTASGKYYLHRNLIAYFDNDKNLIVNNCGWFSNTTKERLNGILKYLGYEGIKQKDFVWYLNGEAWNGREATIFKSGAWQYTKAQKI
tara:strand:+ start:213 stop:542 length:330 start_codon:yes stop_codon:yes gene_type:complete